MRLGLGLAEECYWTVTGSSGDAGGGLTGPNRGSRLSWWPWSLKSCRNPGVPDHLVRNGEKHDCRATDMCPGRRRPPSTR